MLGKPVSPADSHRLARKRLLTSDEYVHPNSLNLDVKPNEFVLCFQVSVTKTVSKAMLFWKIP